MSAFNSSLRTSFFEKSGLPYWDAYYQVGPRKVFYPYALFTCHRETRKRIDEIQRASQLVAETFDKVSQVIKNSWIAKDLEKWKFDPRYAKLLDIYWDDFFMMRVGWAFKDGQLKLIEINSQTPSFWAEPHTGNELLAKKFGMDNPTPGATKLMKRALHQVITESVNQVIPTPQNPKVGFLTCSYEMDLKDMEWLANLCDFDHDVLDIDQVDFTKGNNKPFHRETGKFYDVLIFWYPVEWLVDLKFYNGESVYDVLIEGIKQKSFACPHLVPSFFIQSKAVLPYITKNADKIFTGYLKKAQKYFPKSYFEPTKLGETYFAKPIWGREGRGAYINKEGQIRYSRYQEDYYVKQPKIYQDLLELPTINVEGKSLHVIYECWVYRVNGRLVPGAMALRGSEHPITDDFSYYIPIGV